MNVTVFGGGGFIGSTIVDRLLRDGHAVRVFERPRVAPYRIFAAHEQVEWITGDLLSRHDVGCALEGADAVFHLVSTTLPKSSNEDPIYDVQSNLVASLQMLDAMIEQKVPKIVFISSGGTVYGRPRYTPIDEQHPTEPEVSYGITKLAIEKYLQMYGRLHNIKPVILRVTNPYGERQRIETAQGAVGVFLHRALNGQPIEIWGDGTVQRDFLHVSDVADAFAQALTYTGSETVFNISSGKGLSLNELINMIEKVNNCPIERIYKPARPFDIPINFLCNKLAKKELGWTPMVKIEDGLTRTSSWMKKELGL
ncbi:NAD-dependent epimerase/dehydratase family protein [Pseudomonas sp. BLCC-B13]|uniref:NAD-dependent epimerase/dehydratase family protein n=1 Tax=Pseudomonas sp. BLCC-B13 TaxID=3025314 RepID=UPI00234F6B30|nr:NAD-dependent epimerase/dehydratase family protein [Pseudomonas sp. BLCC-B13]MDC7825599.1 NAD-dependent epimerase/dehydratase family protein [Pseudomonas sp. BLCC-B13]